MVRRCRSVALPLLAIVCTTAIASAQQPTSSAAEGSAPAHVSFVEGSVTLEREGRMDDAPGNMPLLSGDRLRTRNGRVEILFADGSTLHLDHDTTLDLQSDELVRLIGGRVRLSIPGPSREIAYRIDTATGWTQIADAGEYRASFLQNELEVAVLRGRAEIVNEDGRTPLRAGERAFARANAAPSYAYVFNSASWDSFDRWSEGRRGERLGLSTQYLPDEVRPYAASFDRNGSWRYESSYGYVWYPRVEVGWRPYYHGRWATVGPYGATWVSGDPWGWPTHHYGRWGFNAGIWFWIPGRTWGPAWVSWAYAPGYVSWCPLGWNNRPVVQMYGGYYGGHYRGYDPWRAWTVVPYRSFGAGYVHRTVVAGHQIDQRTRGAFVSRDSAPAVGHYAVPRGSSAPIRLAGTGVSRGSSTPLLTNRGTAAGQPTRSAPAVSRAVSRTAPSRLDGGESARRDATTGDGNRAIPSRPMVRSERGLAADGEASDAARASAGVSRAVPRTGDQPAAYQRSDRTPSPSRPGYDAPTRSARPSSASLSAPTARATDAPVYRREDGYRARPDTYAPGGRQAIPRTSGGSAPSYGPPSTGEPRGSRSAPAAAQPPASGGGGDRSAPPSSGSRPSGGAPSRGVARPRGGGN